MIRQGNVVEIREASFDGPLFAKRLLKRNQAIVQMSKIISDEVPSIPIYFNISPIGHVSTLHGPNMGTTESLEFWNIHEWTMD